MWLYKHHTCSDIIDLDPVTGRWRYVEDADKPPGARVLAELPVRGSYTEVDGKRFCSYWTDDDRFEFRTPEGRVIEICRKLPDGTVQESHPGLRCVIEPSRERDGRLKPGWSDVSLVTAQGDVLYRLSYDAGTYLRLYASDFTAAAAMQGLADWDFFVALKEAIEVFAKRAASGQRQLTLSHDGAVIEGRKVPKDDLLFAGSGTSCPRSGVWVCVEDMRAARIVQAGEPMPCVGDQPVQWVWSRSR
jgi:hypothetical protein